MTPLKAQAIQTALTGDWETAISLNLELLKIDPDDIETLNRLAFAFAVLGKTKDAKDTYSKVLQLDSQNPIAIKNLRRLTGMSKKGGTPHAESSFHPSHFDNLYLEESGKTKVIDLLNTAEPKIINSLNTGEAVSLRIKRLKVFILDAENKYIGMLPDNIAKRLIKFIKGGNTYEAYIKAVQNKKVSVFIKETKRAARFKNQPSFIAPDSTHLILEKQKGKDRQDASDDDESF